MLASTFDDDGRHLPSRLEPSVPYLSRKQVRQHLERHGRLISEADLAETNDLLEARRADLRQGLLASHTRNVVDQTRILARDATEAVEEAPAAASILGGVLATYGAVSAEILHHHFGPR